MRNPSRRAPIVKNITRADEERDDPSASGDQRLPGLQWKEWRVVGRTTIGSIDYVLLRRIRVARAAFDTLTKREHDVLRHACKRISNKEIAHEMGIAPSTVSVLISRASRKLGTADRDDLIQKYGKYAAATKLEPDSGLEP